MPSVTLNKSALTILAINNSFFLAVDISIVELGGGIAAEEILLVTGTNVEELDRFDVGEDEGFPTKVLQEAEKNNAI